MSLKLSATYRIKPQTFLILNLAFEKAGPNRPGQSETMRRPIGHGLWKLSGSSSKRRDRPTPTPRTYPLGMVLQACPDIVDYARGGEISSWRDLASAAATVRSALGVSPDAWAQALEVWASMTPSIVIAAILQRGEEIRCAGGYLRVLTAKARAGEFSLGPVLMALLRGKAAKAAGRRKAAG